MNPGIQGEIGYHELGELNAAQEALITAGLSDRAGKLISLTEVGELLDAAGIGAGNFSGKVFPKSTNPFVDPKVVVTNEGVLIRGASEAA